MPDTITQDLTSLVRDMVDTISATEFCNLTSGNASDETINLAKKIIATKYPSLSNFSSSDQVLNLFSIVGTTIDNRVCRQVIEREDDKRPSLRRVSRNLCREDIKGMNLLEGRATPQETIDLLSRVAADKRNSLGEIFRLARPEIGSEEISNLVDGILASPNNLDGLLPRNPKSFNHMQKKIGSKILSPIEGVFNREANDHIPTLFNDVTIPPREGEVHTPLVAFADGFESEIDKQIMRVLRSETQFRDNRLAPHLFYRSYINFRLGSATRDYSRVRSRPSNLYDITEDHLKTKVIPFVTNINEFEPFGYDRDKFNVIYGLIPHRSLPDDPAVQWDQIRDAYTVREVEKTETDDGARDEVVFRVASQERLRAEIANHLKTMGDGQPAPGLPGPVDAFYDIVTSGWLNGPHSSWVTEDFASFFAAEENRGDHYSIFFPEGTRSLMSYLSSEIGASGIFNARSPDNDKQHLLKKLTCDLKIVKDGNDQESEAGILNLGPIIEKIIDLENDSEVDDRASRSAAALCGALYRLYLKVIAIKIVLESMFVFSKFSPKMIFNSKLFMKYFVKYLIREIRNVDEDYLFRMLDYFRNEIASLPQSDEHIDPLTGRRITVVTNYYVSDQEQRPGASQDRAGDHGTPPRRHTLNGDLGNLLDVFDSDDEEGENERGPCDGELGEILGGLIGDGQTDDSGQPLVGFLEYFIKEQLADLVPDLDKTFEKYVRYEGDSLLELLTSELSEYVPEFDVARPQESQPDTPYSPRFFKNLAAEDAFLTRYTADDDDNFQLNIVDEINNHLQQNNLSEQERDFYRSLVNHEEFLDQYGEEEQQRLQQRSFLWTDPDQRRGRRFVREYLNSILSVHHKEDDFIQREKQHFKNGGFIIEKYVRLVQGYSSPVQSLEEFGIALRDGTLYRTLGPADISLEDTDEQGVKQIAQSSPIKFGYRLCYVYPLQLNKEINFTNDVLTLQEDREDEGQIDAFEAWKDLLFGQDLDQLRLLSKRERAFLLREDVGFGDFIGLQDAIIVSDNGMNISEERFGRDDRASLLPEPRQLHYVTVPIAVEEEEVDFTRIRFVDQDGDEALLEREGYYSIGGAEAPDKIFGDRYRSTLRRRLLSGPALKTIFEYCFPLDRFLSFLTIYNAEHIRTMSGREDFLKETQKMIVRTCQISENLKNPDWWAAGVDDEAVFGDNAIKEEQLDVPKNMLPIFTPLKVVEGLVSIVPPLKVWFKGLFSAIPQAFNLILDFPDFRGIPSVRTLLRPLGSLVNLFGEAGGLSSPPLPKMPPYKDGVKDVLEDATDNNVGCDEGGE